MNSPTMTICDKGHFCRWAYAVAVFFFPMGLPGAVALAGTVKLTEQDVVVPTYPAGAPEANPIFYAKRGSQGAQGRVYPYPLYDNLTHKKVDRTYRVVYLENDYVRIGILPEIGGRLFEAVDKSNNYDFIYRQHVIKPALISLIGAWISGGVEWNIPHHHRASTFLPVQYRGENNSDGSKTVWVGELELRHRMRWAVGYTLYPDKSYLECRIRILNRTPVANTMLCFANVAVHVNPRYQVIYPPSTRFVTFHSKVDFAAWPVARSTFNRTDFTRGVDVSWYANHIAPNSMFAWNYEDDFFAGYDHGKNAGIMSVADHHIVPGKKFWTWGNGPTGRYWDKVLTDDDGPYIELMVGGYSDNQPDYSWLQPYETKSFEMYWYPFRDIGGVKNAKLDAAVNLEWRENGTAQVGFCTTAEHREAKVTVTARGKAVFEETIAISPAKPFVKEIQVPAGIAEHDLRASLAANGRELIAYAPLPSQPAGEMPAKVAPPPVPQEIKTVEELYLAGRRIEQFHSPTHEPEPYWEEALKRDPGDSRVHTAWGIRKLKEARFSEAERHFREALKRLTAQYTTPKEGEPFYYLGVALRAQGKVDEAFDAFHKATWSQAWRSPAHVALAEICTGRADLPEALKHVDRALEGNGLNPRALALKAALLRHLGRAGEAIAVLDVAAGKADPLDARLLAERWFARGQRDAMELRQTLREHPATALETALEYNIAGLDGDALALLRLYAESVGADASPLALYLLGDLTRRVAPTEASAWRKRAQLAAPGRLFPFQWEMIPVLLRAIEADPKDARASYYLGNLLFDWQPEEAVKHWERSVAIDPTHAIAHRNLAFAFSHQKPGCDLAKAIAALERAVACQERHALHFAELDDLHSAARTAPEKRLALLEKNHDAVIRRDDALSKEIGLKIFAGKYDEAIGLMTGRTFAVWEGGKLTVADHWVDAHLLRGRQALAQKRFAEALADFEKAGHVPGQLALDHDGRSSRASEIAWWIGKTHEANGDAAKARQAWLEASADRAGDRPPKAPERVSARELQAYYRILALRKLGQTDEGKAALAKLRDKAQQAMEYAQSQGVPAATVAQQRAQNDQLALAHYLCGLGELAAGENAKAAAQFQKAAQAAPDFLAAKQMLSADLRN